MAQNNRAARSVFVGNIPFDASEEDIVEILSQVGPVVAFRMVSDRDTGKPKGFGFAEYHDEETAQSARRNLNGFEFNGRSLRVDYADNDPAKAPGGSRDPQRLSAPSTAPQPTAPVIGHVVAGAAAAAVATALGGAPPPFMNGNPPVNGSAAAEPTGSDAITNTLANMTKTELWEIMNQLKGLIMQNQQGARSILVQNPQLTKALFQAQIMLGMVRPAQQGPRTPPPQPVPQLPAPQQPQQPQLMPSAAPPPTQQGHVRPSAPPSSAPAQQPLPYGMQPPAPPSYPAGSIPLARPAMPPGMPGMPPALHGPGYGAPPPLPPQQRPTQPMPHKQDDAQQRALLEQVMKLTPQEIALLPPQQQQQVLQLQQLQRFRQ
eukprot:jgi/Chlat1/2377/Chrsp17S02644